MTVYTNRVRSCFLRRRERPYSLLMLLGAMLVAMIMGIVGKEDFEDARRVEEFRNEWRVVRDAAGEPQLVRVGGYDEDTLRQLQSQAVRQAR